jgi:hypothetical protein
MPERTRQHPSRRLPGSWPEMRLGISDVDSEVSAGLFRAKRSGRSVVASVSRSDFAVELRTARVSTFRLSCLPIAELP